jgi:hypothetical protein
MDNEFPYEHGEGEAHTPQLASETAAPLDAAAIIEQVRELLFGDQRRAAETSMKGLEDRLAALTATIEARFADFERRLHEVKSEASQAHVSGVDAIGSAIAELGDRIKGLIPRPPQ